jgi:hypothetical protein
VTTTGAFNPRVVLGMLLFGAAAFLAMLWFIGSGQTGRQNDGGTHAAAKGLTGFAALAQVLESDGYEVSNTRSKAQLDDEGLLILTPPMFTDAGELAEVIEARRYTGPTIVVLPKWNAAPAESGVGSEVGDGWVSLDGGNPPFWAEALEGALAMEPALDQLPGRGEHWRGLGMSGRLPDSGTVMALGGAKVVPLVRDAKGRVLAGYLDDGGYYPLLADAAGVARGDPEKLDGTRWNVTVVAEPDLLNNYGMADRKRADLARELIYQAMEGEDLAITFDLTLNGFGGARNLLTLAFEPPFLAATLCLILAMIVVAWRAFRRFGPPLAEARPLAFGKARLVANSAAFIQRTGRLHLLARPYAELVAARIARMLGLRHAHEDAIDEVLARRGPDAAPFSALAAELRAARSRHETLRAARALRDIERMLKR